MRTPPTPAASAVEDPEIPAKSIDTSTLTWPSPPGRWPTSTRDRLISFSVMPAVFIRFAASMKNGIARSRKELYDLSISFNSRNGVSRSSMKKTGTQASPSAKATGTRRMMSSAKTPNKIAATSAGPIAAVYVEFDVVQDLFGEEEQPADSGQRPGDVYRQHVDPGHLRILFVAEQREAPAEEDKDERDQQDRDVDDDARDGF